MRFEIPEIDIKRFAAESVVTESAGSIENTATYQAAQQALPSAVSAENVLAFDY